MNVLKYKGALTAEQYLYYEIRTVAKLMKDDKDLDEIIQIVSDDNLFQYPTEREVKRMAKACYRRISQLESEKLMIELATAPHRDARQIALYALMIDNKIVWDFMIELIGKKFARKDLTFTRQDVNLFMNDLQLNNEDVANWSDKTIQKIKQVLTKLLVDVGYLEDKKSIKINAIYITEALEYSIKEASNRRALLAFNCLD